MGNTLKTDIFGNRFWVSGGKAPSYLDAKSTYQGTSTQMFAPHPDVRGVGGGRHLGPQRVKLSLRALSLWAPNPAAAFPFRAAARAAVILLPTLNGTSC